MTDPAGPTDRPPTGAAWDRALGWAVSGRDLGERSGTDQPDLDRLARELSTEPGLRSLPADRRAGGLPWPFPVPSELMRGLGPAQFAAALAELCRRLGLDQITATAGRPVLSSREPDAAERRLLTDVPPHHGSV